MKEIKLLEKIHPNINKTEELEITEIVDQTLSSEITPEALDKATLNFSPEAIIVPETHQPQVRRLNRFIEYIEKDVEKGVIGRLRGMTATVNNAYNHAYLLNNTENPDKAVKIALKR